MQRPMKNILLQYAVRQSALPIGELARGACRPVILAGKLRGFLCGIAANEIN